MHVCPLSYSKSFRNKIMSCLGSKALFMEDYFRFVKGALSIILCDSKKVWGQERSFFGNLGFSVVKSVCQLGFPRRWKVGKIGGRK